MRGAKVGTTQNGVVSASETFANVNREVMPVNRVYTHRPEFEDALAEVLYLILFGEQEPSEESTSDALTPTCFSFPPE